MGPLVAGGPSVPAVGAHEVFIETARHVDRVSAISAAEFGDVLEAYRQRLGHWHDDGRFEFGLVFKNLGPRAGASLVHLHSQLIALPQLPAIVAAEFQRAEQFAGQQGACPYCRLIENERAVRERVVLDRDGLIAFCPFASLQPCEVWLLPTGHEPWFERPGRNAGDHLAGILHGLVVRIEAIVPQAAYNLVVRSAPWRESATGCGHWRVEILPRVNALAGLELATGIHINPISPAKAAAQLRLS
jgi:UDPglucose--hexose-1-phosphate uridylyltransferase